MQGQQAHPPRPSPNPTRPSTTTTAEQDLKLIFGTQQGTTIVFPGTGTGGWESALTNTLSPGDKARAAGARPPASRPARRPACEAGSMAAKRARAHGSSFLKHAVTLPPPPPPPPPLCRS